MLLWLKEGIEVPEAAFHIIIGRHLMEAHLQKNVAELAAHLHGSPQTFQAQ